MSRASDLGWGTGAGWINIKIGQDTSGHYVYLLLVTCVDCAKRLDHHAGEWRSWTKLITEPTPFVMRIGGDWFLTVWSIDPNPTHSHAGSKRP